MKYAKESARMSAASDSTGLQDFIDSRIEVVVNTYPQFDGTPLKETFSEYTIRRIGNQQKSFRRSQGQR